MLKPNIFIVGATKTGKTTLARRIADDYKLRVVSASEWVKLRFEPSTAARGDRLVYLREITEFSCRELSLDPNACSDFITRTHPIREGGCVIEGLRNPRDFLRLFRPTIDTVVFLHFADNPVPPTAFEADGVAAIRSAAHWMRTVGVAADQLLEFRLHSLGDLPLVERSRDTIAGPAEALGCWTLDELMFFVSDALSGYAELADAPERAVAHVEIDPIDAWVDTCVLFNEDATHTGRQRCRIFGVSSYPARSPTFQVLLGDGAVFSYVPPHRLHTIEHAVGEQYDLAELAYHNCPDEHIAVTRYAALVRPPCRALLRRANRWLEARYLLTIDWYRGNDLLHLVALENGQLACLPHHKVLFADNTTLPPYRKLRADWRVPESTRLAACVWIVRDHRVLAVSRKNDLLDFGLPGGKVEIGETLIEAARRELREETGLVAVFFQPIFTGVIDGRECTTFVARGVSGELSTSEAGAVRYVDFRTLAGGTFGSYNRALMAYVGIKW